MNNWLSILAAVTCTALASPAAARSLAETAPRLDATVQTQATASGEIGTGILVRNSKDPANSRLVATAAADGLEVYDLQGKRLSSTAWGEVVSLDAAYGIALSGAAVTVVAAIDASSYRLRLYTMQDSRLTPVDARPITLGFAAEGVCLYRNLLDGALHAFVVGDGGEIDHQLIYATAQGKLDARQVRRVAVPSPLKQCVVSSDGKVYASEETVGIWRFNADPETYAAPVLIDSPHLGNLGEEVGGLALYDGGKGSRWLIASNASEGRLNLYDRSNDDRYAGSFTVGAKGTEDPIGNPGPLFATSVALDARFPHGALLVVDEDDANLKLVSIAQLARALKREPGTPQDPRVRGEPPIATVTATLETAPVASFGDAADDPTIWVDPINPANSVVIATDKQAGMYVYDMQGTVLQFVPDGKVNNVELRSGFRLGGEDIVLVTASNRTHKSISIYRFDPASRTLADIADGIQPTGLGDPYGQCMYRDPANGRTYVFINGDDTRKRQWELLDAGNGRVRAELVRDMSFASQTEGCAVDDNAGVLYVAEEDVGLWRLSAKPDGGDHKTLIERITDNPATKDDFEGVSIYHLDDRRGYIVVSSQGNDTFAVYRLEGRQEYLGSFAVVADPVLGIDGISETDGIEVVSANLGPGFEHGAMVAQDGRNLMPVQNQNYKYVPWEAIARALKLEMRND